MLFFFVFFNDTATTEIYTLSLHDALPIWADGGQAVADHVEVAVHGCFLSVVLLGSVACSQCSSARAPAMYMALRRRSEEHTSELQSRQYLVCRLLLEKKNKIYTEDLNNSN